MNSETVAVEGDEAPISGPNDAWSYRNDGWLTAGVTAPLWVPIVLVPLGLVIGRFFGPRWAVAMVTAAVPLPLAWAVPRYTPSLVAGSLCSLVGFVADPIETPWIAVAAMALGGTVFDVAVWRVVNNREIPSARRVLTSLLPVTALWALARVLGEVNVNENAVEDANVMATVGLALGLLILGRAILAGFAISGAGRRDARSSLFSYEEE